MDELMKALCYPAKGEIELVERDIPKPGPGEALVKIAASGICHTDIDVLHARYGPGAFPVVPGYEFSGIVEVVHDASIESSTVRPGDRVSSIRTCLVASALRAGADLQIFAKL